MVCAVDLVNIPDTALCSWGSKLRKVTNTGVQLYNYLWLRRAVYGLLLTFTPSIEREVVQAAVCEGVCGKVVYTFAIEKEKAFEVPPVR